MKKALLIVASLLVSVFVVFSGDIKATTTDGRTVILHDNGKWEYAKVNNDGFIGKWVLSADYFDILIDLALSESGINSSDPNYAFYRAYFQAMIAEELGSTDLSSMFMITFNKDGTVSAVIDGESNTGTYKVDSTSRLLTIINDKTKESIPFGIFDETYSKLYIMGMEMLYLEKQ